LRGLRGLFCSKGWKYLSNIITLVCKKSLCRVKNNSRREYIGFQTGVYYWFQFNTEVQVVQKVAIGAGFQTGVY